MNLYNLHHKPKSLLHHDEAQDKVPHLFWHKYLNNPEELRKLEKQIAKDPFQSFEYAKNILNKRFILGEKAISKDKIYARKYKYSFFDHLDKWMDKWMVDGKEIEAGT